MLEDRDAGRRGARGPAPRRETKIKTKINEIEKNGNDGAGRMEGRAGALAKSPQRRAAPEVDDAQGNKYHAIRSLRCRRRWGCLLRAEGATINHSMLIKPPAK